MKCCYMVVGNIGGFYISVWIVFYKISYVFRERSWKEFFKAVDIRLRNRVIILIIEKILF